METRLKFLLSSGVPVVLPQPVQPPGAISPLPSTVFAGIQLHLITVIKPG